MTDFNKLTRKAQEALVEAQRIAAERHAAEIDAEHLLVALLGDPEGTPAIVLRQIGVDVDQLRAAAIAKLDLRPKVFGASEPRFGRELTALLNRAAEAAEKFKDEYVSTEHMLLAIADAPGKSDAKDLLLNAGATYDKILAG